MKKSLLISIQPQHLLNILNGDKTYEVRKVVPKWVLDKLDRGEKVEAYLYCTKPKKRWSVGHMVFFNDELYRTPKGVIKYGSSVELMAYDNCDKNNYLSGKIPAKVVIDGYHYITYGKLSPNEYGFMEKCDTYFPKSVDWVLKDMCLSQNELNDYGNGKDLYALHISKLEIFDKPMELGDFYNHSDSYEQCPFAMSLAEEYMTQEEILFNRGSKKLTKAPQNMQTVWVK